MQIIGRPVVVKLNSGVDYRGVNHVHVHCPPCLVKLSFGLSKSLKKFSTKSAILQVLACLDGYMNIALEQTEEYANGQVANTNNGCFLKPTFHNCDSKASGSGVES